MSDFSTAVLALTPDVYWRLDEASGTNQDSSGNNRDSVTNTPGTGLTTGGPSLVPSDQANDCIRTTGVGDYPTTATDLNGEFSFPLSAHTFAVLFKFDGSIFDVGFFPVFVGTYGGVNPCGIFAQGVGGDQLSVGMFDQTNTWQVAPTSFPDPAVTMQTGRIYFVVQTFDAADGFLRLYINGQQAAAENIGATGWNPSDGPAAYFQCGQLVSLGEAWFDEAIGWFDTALTPTQILNLWNVYQRGAAVTSFADEVIADSPYLWWDTRNASGAVQPDASGNSRTGTITGSPTLDGDGLTFDNTATGDDEYITSDASYGPATPAEFAMEVVFRTPDTTPGFALMTIDEVTEMEYTSVYPTGAAQLLGGQWWSGAANEVLFPLGPVYEANTLVHVVMEFDGLDGVYYVDGVEVERNTTAAGGIDFALAHDFWLANDACGCGDGFSGLIRHGIYYEEALGPARAAAHANAALNQDADVPVPAVTNVSPSSGDIAGGTSVTITGSDFTLATDVDFGATPAASFVIDNDGQITAVSPAHTVGTVDVTVSSTGGTSATSANDEFTFTSTVPTVDTVTPNSGPTAGGNSVVLAGTNFTGTTDVDFGATPAASFLVDNDDQITAVAPAHAPGTVQVVVTTPEGSSG